MNFDPVLPCGAKYVLIDWRDRLMMEFVKKNMSIIKQYLERNVLKDDLELHVLEIPFVSVFYYKQTKNVNDVKPIITKMKTKTNLKTFYNISDKMFPFMVILKLDKDDDNDTFIRLFAIRNPIKNTD